jgi:hypothetical protein
MNLDGNQGLKLFREAPAANEEDCLMRHLFSNCWVLIFCLASVLGGQAWGQENTPERITYAIETDGGRIEVDTTAGMKLNLAASLAEQGETLGQLRSILVQSGRPLMIYLAEGQAVPPELAQQLKSHDITFVTMEVPTTEHDTIVQTRSSWMGQMRARFKHIMDAKPSPTDWFLGITMAAYAGTAGVWAWAHAGILDPWVIAGLAGFDALVTWLQTTHLHRLDRLMGRRTTDTHRIESVSGLNQMARRSFFNLLMTEVVRAVAGPTGTAHSVMSVMGQVEIFSFVAAYGVGQALFNTVRDQLYSDRPEVSRWANFNQFVLMTPLLLMDWAGIHLATLFETSYFHLNLSTTLILAGYATIAASLKYVKPLRRALESIAEVEQRWFERGLRRVARTRAQFQAAASCRRSVRSRGGPDVH